MKKNSNFQEHYYGDKKISFTLPQLCISALVTVCLTIFVMMAIFYRPQQTNSGQVRNQSRTTANGLPTRLVEEMSDSYALIKRFYVGEIDEEKLIDSALAGFVSGLGDQYTSYMTAIEMQALTEATEGEFEGIGVEIEEYNNYIRVVSPIDNSPAYKSGLQAGDIIIAVDGVDIKGNSTTETAKLVRGKKGTSVTLTMERAGSRFDVTIVRDTIPMITVKGTMNGTVGIIRISSFAEDTYDELVAQINRLRASGAKSFIIDVRSNPGGLLDSVEQIVNIFVEDNTVMFSMSDNSTSKEHRSSRSLGTFKVTEPVAVLIDKGSASASEIFAAAIKELNRGVVIGETSFGKGTAQTIRSLSDTTGIKITYSKWLTPSGNWVHEKGVEPNITVSLPEYVNYAYVNTQSLPENGEASDAVLNLQKIMRVLDYNVVLTGIYDEQTAAMIQQFNRSNGIQSATFTHETAVKLNQLLQEKARTNDTQLQEALKHMN